jgi:hypothetical protein
VGHAAMETFLVLNGTEIVPITCAHREVCCPSSWASPMRIPSGPRM